MTEQKMTKISGYYNGNRWPVQLVISKYNLTLTLEAGKYILDRKGRKINDPFFESFANLKQLHRELSDTLVPVIAIPEITPNTPPSQQANPVRAVSSWTRDPRGVRTPVINELPAPVQPPQQALHPAVLASATESVRPMSMDEARRLGLVRKIREVPEDYGVNDTPGSPPDSRTIPPIKYSVDPSINKPPPPLHRELLTLPKDDPNRQVRSQLVSQLSKPVPINETNPFSNTVVVNAAHNSPIVAGDPEPEPEPEIVDSQDADALSDLPEPELEEAPPAPTSPTVQVRSAPAAPPMRQLTPSNQFVCTACGAPHKFRSQLVNHAKTKHPGRVNGIMAAYPES